MSKFSSQNNSYLNDPDVQLMLAFQNGDKSAFEKIMTKYYPRLLNFIYRYISNAEIAEDLTQETFMRVYKSGPNYRPQSKLNTWLFTIAKNLSLNELRRNKNLTVSLDVPVDTDAGPMHREMADTKAKTPDALALEQEKKDTVKAAIAALPENQRVAVLLRRYEQMSYEEIAQTMETSTKAVKSLLNRAKENLRAKLSKFIE